MKRQHLASVYTENLNVKLWSGLVSIIHVALTHSNLTSTSEIALKCNLHWELVHITTLSLTRLQYFFIDKILIQGWESV